MHGKALTRVFRVKILCKVHGEFRDFPLCILSLKLTAFCSDFNGVFFDTQNEALLNSYAGFMDIHS